MVAKIGRLAPLTLAFLSLTASSSTARAQGNTFNPYGNSGFADYRGSGNPNIPSNPSLPGQARINSEPIITRPRANTFDQYTDSLDGREPESAASQALPRGTSAGLPYYRAYRRYDKDYNRIYRANAEADKGFDDRLRQRDQAYLKAQEEKDPIKRARLIRQIEQDSLDRTPAARPRPAASPPAPRGTNAASTTTPGLLDPPTTSSRPRTPAPAPTRSAPRSSPPALGGGPPPTPNRATPRSEPPPPRFDSTTNPAPNPSSAPIPPPG